MKSFFRLLLASLLLAFFAVAAFAQNASNSRDDGPLPRPAQPPRATAKAGQAETEGDDATARALWDRRQQGIPTAEFKRKLMQERAKRTSMERSGGVYGNQVAGPTWIPIGPEGADYESNGGFSGSVRDSGRARKILPHPTDPDTLYFLTSGGGLWVTHNFTSPNTTWTPLTDNLPTTTGGSVAFGRDPNTLYLGTGDPFDVINIGGSMVKSTDGGQTWGPVIDLGAALSVRDILVDTSGPDDVVLVATNDGLYRSTDSGASYAQIQGGVGQLFQGKVIWSLVQTSAGIIANAQTCGGIGDLCATVGGLYVSTDLGATWAAIPNGGNVYAAAGRTTLAVGAPGDSVVYAFAEKTNDSDQLDLFRSADGGLNWTALGLNTKAPTNPNTDNPNVDLMHGQAFYNQMILVDPRDATRNTVYLGGNLSSAKTADGGTTFTLLSNWLYPLLGAPRFGLPYVHADFHAAAVSTAGTPTLIFGSDGGLFVSTDEGVSWSSDKNNGLQTHLLYSISSTPGYPENVIGGFQDNGTRVRKGNTKIYNQSLGGDGVAATWSQGNTNMSATSLPGNGYGINLTNQVPDIIAPWVRFGTGGTTIFYTPITIPSPAAAPSGRILYSANSNRIFWLDMDAPSLVFNVIGQPNLNGMGNVSFRAPVHGLGVSPLDLLHIGIPATGGHIELTANGGASWTDIAMNTVVLGFQSFTQSVTYVDNSTIFVTSVAPTAGAIRVVKSSDGGLTWTASNSGLPDVQVERIIVDPSDPSKQTVLAATYAGVYRSTDQGANWSPYGTGLPSVAVRDIYMPPDGSFVRIATYGRGFWELPSLTYVGASLTDDIASCDHDGSLDNNEKGTLTFTLHNDSGSPLSSVTATVSSTNPAVSFPNGNSINFPLAGANSDTSASITVALAGAVGIQQADFKVSFTDPSLGLPSPVTGLASFRVNVDEVPNSSANDNFEANNSAWTVTGLAESVPDTLSWRHIQISPLEHRWQGLDSNANTDQSLVSPVMQVGNGSFSFSFEHRFRFEQSGNPPNAFYDGMVLELSTDGGTSWTDIGASASPTYNHTLFTPDDNVLSGRPAYSGTSSVFTPVTVILGTTYAGQSVRIRFRVGTDTTGFGPGVDIRNLTTSGLSNTPFTALVAGSGVCPTSTTISSDTNPSNFGDTVTFTSSVSGGTSTPTGTVTFMDGASTIGTGALDAGGQSTFATSALSTGPHSITANYGGDPTHASSVSGTLSQSVQQAGTTASVSSNLNPSVFGQSVTFTAQVTAGAGTPTGSVTFYDGATSLGTMSLSGGTAALSTSALSVATHSITVSYSGDSNYSGATSSPVSQVVNQASSTVALGSSANPVAFGQTVTLTATITPQFGGTATGTVSFTDGANSLGSAPVSGNSAALQVSTLAVGGHSLKAAYSGDTNVSGNASSVLNETVSKASSSVGLTSSANPAGIGQSVTYTATVSPQFSGTPTGAVTFKQGGVVLNTDPLSGGVATFTTSYASAGSFSIKANYSGDGNFTASASAVLKEVVNRTAVDVAVSSDVNPSSYGQTVNFTATLTSSGPTLDGQTVTFKNGATPLGSATISGGSATLSTAVLAAGNRTITASYAGDGVHAPASGTMTQVVSKASTSTTLTSDVNPSGAGQPVTFTATVSSAYAVPTGTVKFKSGPSVLGTVTLSGGVATFTTSTLPPGSNKITATFTATPNFTGSSASLVQKVQ